MCSKKSTQPLVSDPHTVVDRRPRPEKTYQRENQGTPSLCAITWLIRSDATGEHPLHPL